MGSALGLSVHQGDDGIGRRSEVLEVMGNSRWPSGFHLGGRLGRE